MRILVTGGAGYIGGHVVRKLAALGNEVHVVDDMSTGHSDAVHGVPLTVGDITSRDFLRGVVDRAKPQAIFHFAARIQVGESVSRPDLYYSTNVGGAIQVAGVAQQTRVPVVYSSTAAVYGDPEVVPIPSGYSCRPANPYGWSKWMGEQILADAGRAGGFSYAVLRYFNAAGADVAAGCGERHTPETHLVPLAIDAARRNRAPLKVFGADWPTRDGTCVRDYVHVSDLADAHVRALEVIAAGASSFCLNLGAGVGTTVREVLQTVEEVGGRDVPFELAQRRPGDVAQLVADISEARRVLSWMPSRSSIRQIVADAYAVR